MADLYPGSIHVQSVGLDCATDAGIWDFARENDYVIVTKDVDYSDQSSIKGFPPKIIWLRIGNCTTQEICALLKNRHEQIHDFYLNQSVGVMTFIS